MWESWGLFNRAPQQKFVGLKKYKFLFLIILVSYKKNECDVKKKLKFFEKLPIR